MKRTYQTGKRLLTAFSVILLSTCTASFADCSQSQTLVNIPLSFYKNSLGTYNIILTDTLTAIATGTADSNGYSAPYYEKNWMGACPGGLTGENCHEYTVYPDATNFAPGDIMSKIEQYTNGESNRGEVRILTDSSETYYVYSTDHEQNFCGPYPMPGIQSRK